MRGEWGAGGAPLIFQQDNASIHRARATTEWLREQEWATVKWPARSPDFSPIEFLWQRMSVELDELWRPSSVAELKRCLPLV